MQEIDIVNFIQNQRLSQFCHRLSLDGHQRWFVNKFNKYNLDAETTDQLEEDEKKEAKRIKAGYDEEETYKSIHSQVRGLCL